MSTKKMFPGLILCGVPFLMVLGNSMLIPVLPQMKAALSLSQVQVGLVITLFSVPAGVIIPLFGFLSDHIRRKPIIIISLIIYALGGLLAGFVAAAGWKNAYFFIMIGRIIQGIGAAGTAPLAMALVGDLYQDKMRGRVLGFLEGANGLGKIASPIIGSLIGLLAWWAVFFLFPLLCIPLILGLWFGIQEPVKQKETLSFTRYGEDLGEIFQCKGFALLGAFLAGATVLFVLFGLLFYLSDFLEVKYQLEGVKKGLIIAIPVLAMTITSSLVGFFITRSAGLSKILVCLGLGLVSGASFLLVFFKERAFLLVATMVIAGIGTGMALTSLNSFVTGASGKEERGMITSLYGSVRFLGVAAGPPTFGFLMEKSLGLTFLLPAIWTGLVGLLNLFPKRQ